VLATGGCFATRGDVVKLQNTVFAMQEASRLQQAASDSAHRAQMVQLARQVTREVGALSDTLRIVSELLRRFQGDVSLWSHSVDEQLLALQELTGQSQKRLQELKAEMEAREAQFAVPPTGAPAGTATAPAVTPPNQLFQLARQQLQGGATGAARAAFEEFLTQYPAHELAGEAQMWIAESYDFDGNKVAADSAYALVVQKYAGSPAASRSLYKRALLLRDAGRVAEARALLQQIVERYPRSNEFLLAQDLLRTLKP